MMYLFKIIYFEYIKTLYWFLDDLAIEQLWKGNGY